MTQYSKRLVIVHWLTLALLIAAWVLGDSLADATDDGQATTAGYLVHILAGSMILLLTLMRLFFRSADGTPPQMGNTPMDKVAKGVHHMLYLVLFLLPLSGLAILFTSKAGTALLSGDAALLPKKFHGVFAHEVHEQLVTVLIVLAVVHMMGAIKHQFIMKDGLMERMMLRRKD